MVAGWDRYNIGLGRRGAKNHTAQNTRLGVLRTLRRDRPHSLANPTRATVSLSRPLLGHSASIRGRELLTSAQFVDRSQLGDEAQLDVLRFAPVGERLPRYLRAVIALNVLAADRGSRVRFGRECPRAISMRHCKALDAISTTVVQH